MTGNTCHAFYIFCKFYSQCCKWKSRLRGWTYPTSPNKIIKQISAPQGRNLKAMVLIVLTDKAYHTQSVRRAGRKRLFPANECMHVTRFLDLTNEDALLLLASMMLHIAVPWLVCTALFPPQFPHSSCCVSFSYTISNLAPLSLLWEALQSFIVLDVP